MTSVIGTALDSASESILIAFGAQAQRIKACEEMSELITQLCKTLNENPVTKEQLLFMNERVVDEIADVFITVAQMRVLFGRNATDARITEKLSRTLDIIRAQNKPAEIQQELFLEV